MAPEMEVTDQYREKVEKWLFENRREVEDVGTIQRHPSTHVYIVAEEPLLIETDWVSLPHRNKLIASDDLLDRVSREAI